MSWILIRHSKAKKLKEEIEKDFPEEISNENIETNGVSKNIENLENDKLTN